MVDDKEYLETIFELTKDLWKVVVLQSRPHKGNIGVVPFELLWEKKTDLSDFYGGSSLTKEFFAEELINDMEDEFDEDDELHNAPFEITEKKKLSDVASELPNVIHKPYGYYEFSDLDNSNYRFMRKQENTNALKDTIFNNINNEENKSKDNENIQKDLFENIDEVPF